MAKAKHQRGIHSRRIAVIIEGALEIPGAFPGGEEDLLKGLIVFFVGLTQPHGDGGIVVCTLQYALAGGHGKGQLGLCATVGQGDRIDRRLGEDGINGQEGAYVLTVAEK